MKALQILSAVMLALTATFAVTLGVVCLMYWFNLDASPRMREEWPTILRVTSIFWVLSGFAALSWLTLRRRVGWMWPAQLVSAVGLVVGTMLLMRALSP